MTQIARCQCQGFRVIVANAPEFVNICQCTDCQRRSGSPLTSNAYFPKTDVRLEGDYKIYSRPTTSGRQAHNYFCPNCGSTLCWILEIRPDHYGVAAGAFNDPAFPVPSVSVWESSKYHWILVPPDIEHFPRGLPSEG
jgi:hypothetical protein